MRTFENWAICLFCHGNALVDYSRPFSKLPGREIINRLTHIAHSQITTMATQHRMSLANGQSKNKTKKIEKKREMNAAQFTAITQPAAQSQRQQQLNENPKFVN